MRRAFILLALIALWGCERSPWGFSESELTEIKLQNPGMISACIRSLRRGGMPAWPRDTEKCFEMRPAKRWHGLMVFGFEIARFCPAPAIDCDYGPPEEKIWVEFSDSGTWPTEVSKSRLYEVDFIGRRTAVPGHHGHLAAYDHVIVVDEVIAVKPLAQE